MRYIIFLDGTRNGRKSNTNIWQMSELSSKIDQEVKYLPGVGVRPWEQIRGGVFGRKLSSKIREAYEWLARHHKDDDEIFIFGFSRGAFAAMGLAGMLAWRGLPKKKIPPRELKRQFSHYRRATQLSREEHTTGRRSLAELSELSPEERNGLSIEDKKTLENFRSVPIKFLGLFENVRAAGLEAFQWLGPRLPPEELPSKCTSSRGTLALRYTLHLPPNVERAFHALAVDEHRAAFYPRRWIIPRGKEDTPKEQLAEQRWFVGAHANVGGGYPGNQLACIPLRWMQDQADSAGMLFQQLIEVPSAAHLNSKVEDSYGSWFACTYRFMSWRPFNRPIFAWQTTGEEYPTKIKYVKQVIDRTVLRRILQDKGYRPQNIKDCLDRLHDSTNLLLDDNSFDKNLVDQCLREWDL